MNSGIINEKRYVLPELAINEPKTGVPLMVATPQPGALFDVKMPADITPAQLVIVVTDLVQYHMRHCAGVQDALFNLGMSHDQVSDIFFPGVPEGGGEDKPLVPTPLVALK